MQSPLQGPSSPWVGVAGSATKGPPQAGRGQAGATHTNRRTNWQQTQRADERHAPAPSRLVSNVPGLGPLHWLQVERRAQLTLPQPVQVQSPGANLPAGRGGAGKRWAHDEQVLNRQPDLAGGRTAGKACTPSARSSSRNTKLLCSAPLPHPSNQSKRTWRALGSRLHWRGRSRAGRRAAGGRATGVGAALVAGGAALVAGGAGALLNLAAAVAAVAPAEAAAGHGGRAGGGGEQCWAGNK